MRRQRTAGWSVGLGHLCLFIGAYPEEKQTSHMFMTGSSDTNYCKVPSEAESDILFLHICVSKKQLSGPWRDSSRS